MVYAMDDYWQDHPPLHLMVAQFLGVEPGVKNTRGQDLHELAEYLPVATLKDDEFQAVLAKHGLANWDIGEAKQ